MYTLDDICKEFLIEGGDTQLNKYARIYTIAVSGLREFNMDTTGIPKVEEICITDIDTVNIPFGCIRPTRIAICGNDGKLHTLGEDNNICLGTNFDCCGVEDRPNFNQNRTRNQVFFAEPHFIAEHIRNGEVMGRFFGIGGGNNANGTYRFDWPSGQIQLGNRCHGSTHITLEYLSDINTISGDFLVHPFIIEALKAWIHWKIVQRDRTRSGQEKEMAMIDFQKAERIARIRFNSNNATDWLMAFRSGNKAAPKF